MNYLDELNNKKNLQSDEQKRLEQIEAVNTSGEKIVGAVENSKQELTGSLNNLLMATLVSKDPEIAKTAKSLVNLSSQIDKATQNIKDANFKPLSDNLKVLQSTLKDIPGQIEQALQAQDPSQELREIAAKLGQIKYDPNIKVDVSAPKVDFTPITKLLSNIEKAFKDFKVELPESDFGALQSEVKGVKSAINNLVFPTANYVLPFSKDGKATQVVLDASGNVPISGSISVDTTGLATGTKQDAQTALLTTIDADTGAIKTAVEIIDNAIAGSEMQVDVVTSALPSGAATSAKQDTMIGHLDGVEGLLTTIDSDTGSLAVVGSGTEATAQRVTIATDSTGVLSVDDNGSSLTVDGSVTANAGTNLNTSALALDTTLTGGTQKSQIVDAGGDAVTVTGGKLDVNATISGSGGGTSSIDDAAFAVGVDTGTPIMGIASSDTIDSGDVGVVAMDTSRNLKVIAQSNSGVDIGDVTINNSTGASAVNIQDGGNSITVDQGTAANLNMTEANSAAIKTAVETIDNIVSGTGANISQVGGTNIDTNSGVKSAGTQRIVLATDQPQLTNALKVDGSATTQPVSGTVTAISGTAANLKAEVTGATSGSGTSTGAIRVELPTNGTGVVGLNAGTNTIGKLAANSGVDIGDVDVTSIATGTNAIGRVGHDVTGIGHGVTTVTTAGTDVVLAGSTACKEVTIQAQTDNTSSVAVGGTGVDATVATGTGVLLGAGDSITLKCDNLADIYIDSLVSGEGVRYVYLT